MVLDWSLRLISLALIVLMFYQIRLSKGGDTRHVAVGWTVVALGVIVAILVTVRGLAQESTGLLYVLHLATGAPFFMGVFATGFLGWRARRDDRYAQKHWRAAKATFLFLILTLVMGIVSYAAH